MAGQEFQYVDKALKEVYAPAIVNQIPKKSPLWAQIQKKQAKAVGGKYYVIPVQLSFVESVSARAANDYSLPEASRITYDRAQIAYKKIYGRVMIDGFSWRSSQGKEGAWVDLLNNEIKGAASAFALDVNRQLLCGGKGIMALVSAVNGSELTVKDAGGITGDTPANKFFRKGMALDIYSAAGAKRNTGALIVTDVSADGTKITVSGTMSGVVANDIIYKEKVYGVGDNIGELMGIDGIVGTGNTPGNTFQGIDATAEPLWRAYVVSNVGALTELKIQEALDAIDARTDGDPVNLAVTGYTLRNKLISLMQALRTIDTLDLKAGWKAIKYIGGAVELPFLVEPKTPNGYIYLLSTNHLTLHVLEPLTWDNTGGGVIKPVSGYDAYEAWFKFYGNLGTDARNAHGKMTGVTA